MVQREVADRFFAEPGTKAYGAVSVLVRLHARRTGFHPVSRTVFRPAPKVDSALVAFERITPTRRRRSGASRSSPARSRTGARRSRTRSRSPGSPRRERAVGALAAIDRPADVRAEALQPEEFVRLTEALRHERVAHPRGSGEAQPRPRRRPATPGRQARGRHRDGAAVPRTTRSPPWAPGRRACAASRTTRW